MTEEEEKALTARRRALEVRKQSPTVIAKDLRNRNQGKISMEKSTPLLLSEREAGRRLLRCVSGLGKKKRLAGNCGEGRRRRARQSANVKGAKDGAAESRGGRGAGEEVFYSFIWKKEAGEEMERRDERRS